MATTKKQTGKRHATRSGGSGPIGDVWNWYDEHDRYSQELGRVDADVQGAALKIALREVSPSDPAGVFARATAIMRGVATAMQAQAADVAAAGAR